MRDLDVHLEGIRAGNPAAFAQWLAGAEPRVRGSLRSFAAYVDCEAVVQETLLRVWQVAPRIEPDGRPDALLRLGIRIARNLAVSEARRRRTASYEPEVLQALADASASDVEGIAPDPMLRKAIAHCRDKLPARPRQALVARLESGGTEPDQTLAARAGMTLNTFLKNVGRARKLLAACLRSLGIVLASEVA